MYVIHLLINLVNCFVLDIIYLQNNEIFHAIICNLIVFKLKIKNKRYTL